MRSLVADERRDYLSQQQEKREVLQKRITGLLAEREEHLEAERARRIRAGEDDGFDAKVHETIRRQAADKGIRYD